MSTVTIEPPEGSNIFAIHEDNARRVYNTAKVQLGDADLVVTLFEGHPDKPAYARKRLDLMADPKCPANILENIKKHPTHGKDLQTPGFWLILIKAQDMYVYAVMDTSVS
jgi:hypothetical protein